MLHFFLMYFTLGLKQRKKITLIICKYKLSFMQKLSHILITCIFKNKLKGVSVCKYNPGYWKRQIYITLEEFPLFHSSKNSHRQRVKKNEQVTVKNPQNN